MRAPLQSALCLAALLFCSCVALATGAGKQTYGKPCDPENLPSSCNDATERCSGENNQTAKCICILGYEWNGKRCSPRPTPTPTPATTTTEPSPFKPQPEPHSAKGSPVAVLVLVPFTLALVSVVAFMGAKRYKWLQRFRQFRQNRYGSVLVTRDDTDDDDPPIA